jgi:hypothetical protein
MSGRHSHRLRQNTNKSKPRIGGIMQGAPDQNGNNALSRRRTREWEPSYHDSLPVTPDRRVASFLADFLSFEAQVEESPLAESAPFAIITQSSDSEMEMEDEDTSQNIFTDNSVCTDRSQRKKCRIDNYMFHPAVKASIPSTIIASPNPNTNASANVKNQQHQYWWKDQIPSDSVSKALEQSCKCHVCQAPASQIQSQIMTHEAAKDTNGRQMKLNATSLPKQKNSLLSYFNPTKAIQNPTAPSMDSRKFQPVSMEPSLSSCAYCDRPACASCIRSCEGGCNEGYCTFCSRIDYEGIQERIFCFSCQDENSSCRMDVS